MFRTIEVRWFGQQTIPSDLRTWFELCPGKPEHQPQRIDFYLQPIMDSGLSVKLRDGGIELKLRQQSYGPVFIAHSLMGLVESWIKWRFPFDMSRRYFQTAVTEGSYWIAIEKRRQLKRYRIGESGAPDHSASESVVHAGCELELSSIQVGADRGWTVAFEADAEVKAAPDRLLALTNELIGETVLRKLSIQNSFAYPKWLSSLPDQK